MNPPFHRSSRELAARTGIAYAVWPADLATPVRLFLAMRASGHHACLLESVEGPARLARYSFIGVDPDARFRGRRGENVLSTAAGEQKIDGAVHEALRKVAGKPGAPPPLGLPPFLGGWIGWFAYEWSGVLEPRVPRARRDPWNVPDATFDLYSDVLAFDHAAQKIFVATRCAAAAGPEAAFAAAHERIDALAGAAFREDPVASGDFRLRGEFVPCTEPAVFERGVESLRASISRGEIFQAVLSQRFEQRFEGDPFTLYRVLRLANPSPHMFFFEADGLALVGSSPERLVSVQGRKVENRPIAGTRPRSEDLLEDERLARELRSDPKERAEHDMLVDLSRNDLGRIARIGTVCVKEHAVLERFARVQHLVSRVECDLAAGRDAIDALAASFPAGTVSGAPKVRAMEILAGLEEETRGPYAGAFGYLDLAGNLDTAIVIRSFAARVGILSAQAGAGVVWDSDPAREREETLHKARALFEAARRADSDAFRGAPPESAQAAAGAKLVRRKGEEART